MENVILRLQGTESTLAVSELTIERILAEARATGLNEFALYQNGKKVENPHELMAQDGDLFVILPADYEDVEIMIDIANDPE